MSRRDDIIRDLQARLAEGDDAVIILYRGPYGTPDIDYPPYIWGGSPKSRERALKVALKIIEAEKQSLLALINEMFDSGWAAGRTSEEQKAELRRRAIARRTP